MIFHRIINENILYVPRLGGNLLSIGRIEEKGLKIEFTDGKARMIDNNGETLLSAGKKCRPNVIDIEEKTITATPHSHYTKMYL